MKHSDESQTRSPEGYDFSYVQLSAALNGLSRLLALPWFGQTLSALCRRCLGTLSPYITPLLAL